MRHFPHTILLNLQFMMGTMISILDRKPTLDRLRELIRFSQGHTTTRVTGLRFKSDFNVCVILNSFPCRVIQNREHKLVLVQIRVPLHKWTKTRTIIKYS